MAFRANTAKHWPALDASISLFSAEPSSFGIRPVVLYSYVLHSENWRGSCIGQPIKASQLEKVRSALLTLPTMRVRYDPRRPGVSRALNRDNPGVPFKIDDEPHFMILAGLSSQTVKKQMTF
jgi:hypothetical protein